jgi:hypothetical protein
VVRALEEEMEALVDDVWVSREFPGQDSLSHPVAQENCVLVGDLIDLLKKLKGSFWINICLINHLD